MPGRPDLQGLRIRFGCCCWSCGYRPRVRFWRLHFAHTAPTGLRGRGRGQWDRYCDIRRNPDRYALLCVRCHRKFDALQPVPRATAPNAWMFRPAPEALFASREGAGA